MNWYIVDKRYIKYLLQYDSKVGYVECGDKLKLHIGTLISINNHNYYVPITSAKPKHNKMSNSIDFHKISDATSEHLYAVLNLNNMIPVPDSCVTQLKYDKIEEFRHFGSEKEKTDYIYLLQKEKRIIDDESIIIQSKAQKLYSRCIKYPQSALASRCYNFRVLEEKCTEYINT